ncbi:MAG TPA: glycosyltransferase family 39 protein [Patescibacteria group bacterium]|nr:glycosyltransferase family 39 protein [Patescibacteria group bacterium]
MKQTFLENYWLLICIVLFAAALRFIALTQIPASLNIDEQALGYNAYSLMKTGYDEHGKYFPISLESFGDWKLIGYPLVTIPSIAIFGLNDFSIRFPSALAGVVQVILTYFLVLKLFQKKRVALFAAVFFTVSPWGIYFSRMAFEVNIATMYFLGGLLAFLHYIQNVKKKLLFLVSCLLLSATMFTYHSFVIFTPLFCMILFSVYWKKLPKNVFFYAGLCIFLVVIILVGKSVYLSSTGKISSLAIWNDKGIVHEITDVFRIDGSNDKILGRIFYSKPFAIPYKIGENYLEALSPSFLFDTGGSKLVNSLGYFGNFYLLDAILLIFGCIGIMQVKEKNKVIFVLWFLLGILPSAITNDSQSSTRLFLLLPLFIIVMSIGAEGIISYAQRNTWVKLFSFCFLIGYMINILYFFDAYYLHINYQKAQYLHYGFEQAVELSEKYPSDQVVMFGPENFPYISFLLYTKYDPAVFRKEVVYYPKNYAAFDEVKSFGKYHFVDYIDYAHLRPHTLYIDYRGIGTKDMTINFPNGQPVMKYFFKTP